MMLRRFFLKAAAPFAMFSGLTAAAKPVESIEDEDRRNKEDSALIRRIADMHTGEAFGDSAHAYVDFDGKYLRMILHWEGTTWAKKCHISTLQPGTPRKLGNANIASTRCPSPGNSGIAPQ